MSLPSAPFEYVPAPDTTTCYAKEVDTRAICTTAVMASAAWTPVDDPVMKQRCWEIEKNVFACSTTAAGRYGAVLDWKRS